MLPNSDNRFYILVGDRETWNTSLLHKMWGFSDRTRGLWNTSHVGDFMAFYVTSPVSKVIGFGKLTEKFVDVKLIWPDEKLFRRPIWKYRIQFDNLLLTDNWAYGIAVPSHILLNTGRKLIDERLFSLIMKQAIQKWPKKASVN